jgi:hypothetical protein
MPIGGFPDKERHRLCIRCGQWHEPDEGRMVYPDAAGLLSGIRRAAAVVAEDESARRFMCYRCMRVRRYTRGIIFGSLAFVILLVLVLERLGLLSGNR